MGSSPTTTSELPQPDNLDGVIRTFAGYRAALSTMTPAQLMEQLTTINAAIQAQQTARLEALLSRRSQESTSSLDQPVVPTTRPRSTPAPQPRGRAAAGSPQSLPPSQSNPLLRSHAGQRLAAKLVAANARSIGGIRR